MITIPDRVEAIFARAALLHQSGRLKTTIYVHDNLLYLVNADLTMLLRFKLHKTEAVFPEPLYFLSNDYAGSKIYERDGRLFFVKEDKGNPWVRTKSCGKPPITYEMVHNRFEALKFPSEIQTSVDSSLLTRFDDGLSHIEILARRGAIRYVQRDIYSGAVYSTEKKRERGLGLDLEESIADFGPVGVRTDDFSALLEFSKRLNLFFDSDNNQFFGVRDPDKSEGMQGIIACCIYDELATIAEIGGTDHGRQEQKVGGSVEGAGCQADGAKGGEGPVDQSGGQGHEVRRPQRTRSR